MSLTFEAVDSEQPEEEGKPPGAPEARQVVQRFRRLFQPIPDFPEAFAERHVLFARLNGFKRITKAAIRTRPTDATKENCVKNGVSQQST